MTIPSDLEPFAEHDKIDQEMKILQDELRKLGELGQYEEVDRRVRDELVPLHKKWLESLYQSFNNLRNSPHFY